MELRLSGFWDLNIERGSVLAMEFPDRLDTATGSVFDINVAMEKGCFAPSKGGRARATTSKAMLDMPSKEDQRNSLSSRSGI
jgi:hypothetical protein